MTELSLLCVHPHPDDESIACGGVLARYAAEGHHTHVVTCTGGEAGENLAGIDLGDRSLEDHRRDEMEAAVIALGVAGHTWLGYRDSGMQGTDENDHAEAFVQADLYEAAARLARVIRRERPHVIVSDDANGTYGHPDHVKAHRVTERALVLAADEWWTTPEPAWTVAKRYVHTISRDRIFRLHQRMMQLGLPSAFGDEPISDPSDLPFGVDEADVTTIVPVADYLPTKQAALAAHRTQIGEDSFFLNTPPEMAAEGFGIEEFVLISSNVGTPSDGPEVDLFTGLR